MERVLHVPLMLTLFDTQTTLLNTTGNDLSPEMKTYYQDRLIDNAEPALVHDRFGTKYPIPKGKGKTTEFRKYSPLPKALTPLTEGVTPAGNKLNVTTVEATVAQYGDFIEISDVLDLTAIDRNLEESTKLLGGQAGRTCDTVTREVITAGTNVWYAPKDDGTEITSRAAIDRTCLLTPKVVRHAVAALKRMNTQPLEDGHYIAIIHTDTATDIMDNEEWAEMQKYVNPEKMYDGEVGRIGGVVFVESTEAKIWGGAGAGGDSVYGTLIIGANAYGVTDVEGGGLQHIVKQLGSSGTADPLNQRATSGWKAMKTAERLVEEYMIRVEHGSGTNPQAESN
ncbi:MAG TPA: N4-gp56 family major capsid protein [Clostridiales bacterium]|nr:N4-gp56 family major capsid protein [Clostridiales bacterium]